MIKNWNEIIWDKMTKECELHGITEEELQQLGGLESMGYCDPLDYTSWFSDDFLDKLHVLIKQKFEKKKPSITDIKITNITKRRIYEKQKSIWNSSYNSTRNRKR